MEHKCVPKREINTSVISSIRYRCKKCGKFCKGTVKQAAEKFFKQYGNY